MKEEASEIKNSISGGISLWDAVLPSGRKE
jgi:hypothetical protein